MSDEIDINKRINLKALVKGWLAITKENFVEELDTKLYKRRRTRSRKPLQRTMRLRNDWNTSMRESGGDVSGAQLSFMLHGRFVDMGVGKGLDYALAKYQRVRSNGEAPSRRPVRWYSKRKGYETHRLRELLVAHHIDIPLAAIENALSTRVDLNA